MLPVSDVAVSCSYMAGLTPAKAQGQKWSSLANRTKIFKIYEEVFFFSPPLKWEFRAKSKCMLSVEAAVEKHLKRGGS